MPYHVSLTARASRDLECLYDSIHADTSQNAFEWFNELVEMICSLDRLPERGALSLRVKTQRQLFFGDKPHIYKIIYDIDKRRRAVTVLHIRHGARAL